MLLARLAHNTTTKNKYRLRHKHAIRRIERTFTSVDYGSHFDSAAKDRMISGCNLLKEWLTDYRSEFRGNCIEFGPFTNPLMTPDEFPLARITYVDADAGVIEKLKYRFKNHSKIRYIQTNLDQEPQLAVKLALEKGAKYNSIIASQILNYLDFRDFFYKMHSIASPGARAYINNVCDYGIPELFSPRRPENDSQIIEALIQAGWKISKTQTIPSPFIQQANSRLLVMAEKPITSDVL